MADENSFRYMKTSLRRIAIFAVPLVAVTVLQTGCGGKHGATVNGTVLLDGEPLPEDVVGTVAFFPTAGGPPATGKINDDSRYELSTGMDRSLPPGNYTVTIGANERPASARGPNGGPPPAGKAITPPRYRRSKTSGLEFTVQRGGNTIDLELSSDAT